MKKPFLPILFACALAASCTRRAETTEELVLATVSDSLEVVPEALSPDEGVCASAAVCLEIPQKGLRGKSLRNIRRSIVSEALGQEYARLSVADAIAAGLSAYSESYQQDAREIAGSEEGNHLLHTLNYSRKVSGEVVSLCGGILAYRILVSDYSGGAHGTETEKWLNFKAGDGSLLRPETLFTESGRETLDYLLKTELQAGGHTFWNYGSEENPWLDKNFRLDADSVRFLYNPYEVDCYAAGQVHVALPVEKVLPLIDEKKLKLNLENSCE